MFIKLLLVWAFIAIANGQVLTFDFYQPVTISQLRSLGNDGYANVSLRAMAPTGTFDTNCCANIQRSVLGASIYVTPLLSADAKSQVHLLNNGLYNCNFFFNMYWLQVVNSTAWKDVKTNVQFILDTIDEAHKIYRQNIGFYTTADDWNKITGGINITDISGLYHPLWYRGSNSDTNFDDFKSFGGWVSPVMKQLKAIVVENISGNSNFFAHNW